MCDFRPQAARHPVERAVGMVPAGRAGFGQQARPTGKVPEAGGRTSRHAFSAERWKQASAIVLSAACRQAQSIPTQV